MYKIKIKGTASADYYNVEALDDIDCQDEFSEYFGKNEQALIDKGVCNGYMSFIYENEELWTITTYSSNKELTPEELQILGDYTQGQWSDGIGEGFEQNPCMYADDDDEVYISPWHRGQALIIEQIEIK